MKIKQIKQPNKLVRGNWYVTKNQMKLIKKKAKESKISESEVIRTLISTI